MVRKGERRATRALKGNMSFMEEENTKRAVGGGKGCDEIIAAPYLKFVLNIVKILILRLTPTPPNMPILASCIS